MTNLDWRRLDMLGIMMIGIAALSLLIDHGSVDYRPGLAGISAGPLLALISFRVGRGRFIGWMVLGFLILGLGLILVTHDGSPTVNEHFCFIVLQSASGAVFLWLGLIAPEANARAWLIAGALTCLCITASGVVMLSFSQELPLDILLASQVTITGLAICATARSSTSG